MEIMGILNVTPDSFSDGGHFFSMDRCLEQVDRLVGDGADIIDIGGESTRPFAEPVSEEDELERVVPVIRAIRQRHSLLRLSIDTTKARVAEEALDAGADMINDVSALDQDQGMIDVLRQTAAPVIIMHRQGTPANMQVDPHYDNVVGDIASFFRKKITWLQDQGINKDRITIDPGIGFGKTLEHNLSILKHLDAFSHLGQPVLLGHSRKRFIGDITKLDVDQRDLPTAVISALSALKGVSILRVHDVRTTHLAVQLAQAIDCAA